MNKYFDRIQKLKPLMDEAGIEAFYINNVPNVAYFTGTKGDDLALYITKTKAYIITDFRYREMASALSGWLTYVETTNSYKTIDFIKEQSEKLIGIEKNYLPLTDYLEFTTISGKEFKPVEELVESLREVKDEEEIEYTKRACEIACNAFDYMLTVIKPGMTELQLAAELEYFMRRNGAEGTSFDTILVTGATNIEVLGRYCAEDVIGDDCILHYRKYIKDKEITGGICMAFAHQEDTVFYHGNPYFNVESVSNDESFLKRVSLPF